MRELTKAGAAGSPDTVLGPIRREHLQRYSTLVVLILMFAVFALAVDKFLTSQNLLNIAQQISILTIVGAGLTFGFAAREMDLSVGFAVGLAGIVVPLLLVKGVALPLALLAISSPAPSGVCTCTVSIQAPLFTLVDSMTISL